MIVCAVYASSLMLFWECEQLAMDVLKTEASISASADRSLASVALMSFQGESSRSKAPLLQFRTDFFNLFNHPSFANPAGRLSSGLFGVSGSILAGSPGSSVSGGFSPLYQFGGSRSIQFSLKLKF